jgi:glycerol-3-phosphate dehydrogenase (NAD(P)+)
MKIAVLGAGSWGTALGQVLNENGHDVRLWHLEQDFVDTINQSHEHPFLPDVKLNHGLQFTSSLEEICNYGELLVSAVPSQVVRLVLEKFPDNWEKPIVSVSKGIENNTGMRMSEVIAETLHLNPEEFVILSGPSHAEEVSKKYPTTVVAACENIENARNIQKIFSNDYFRVYSGSDVIGVEIGGAAKNIIALAAGICHGLGFGDNTMAALVTRGLEEIIRYGSKMGAERSTFSGLSGMGDLVVTAFSPHSRNRQVGERIGKGEKLSDILASMEMVAEGVETTRSIHDVAQKNNIDMPLCEQIYQVLFKNVSPRKAILELMGRELVDEHPV